MIEKKFLLFKYIKNDQEYKITITNNNLLKANIFYKYKLQKHLISSRYVIFFRFIYKYINFYKFLIKK